MSFVQLFPTHMLSLESILGFCHGIAKGGDCKVEFIQPSNWLYSVSNLLVIQHLVTLYLGGFDVRVVSEMSEDCSRVCKKIETRGWASRVTRGFKPLDAAHVPSMLEGEQSCKLEHYRTKQDNWPYGYLATGSRDSVKSRGQAASHSCFVKPDVSHSSPTPV